MSIPQLGQPAQTASSTNQICNEFSTSTNQTCNEVQYINPNKNFCFIFIFLYLSYLKRRENKLDWGSWNIQNFPLSQHLKLSYKQKHCNSAIQAPLIFVGSFPFRGFITNRFSEELTSNKAALFSYSAQAQKES